MPLRARASEPRPASEVFAAPEANPVIPLPGPLPWPMPAPLPAPPKPGLSSPDGDMAKEPVSLLLGKPTFAPGWLESTAPALASLPLVAGGTGAVTASAGMPKGKDLLRFNVELLSTTGGGATTLLAANVLREL